VNSTSHPIRVLSVDDHPLLRQGIAGLVAEQSDMIMVGEAANGREAIQRFRDLRPDVMLMDLQMPELDGLDAIIAIRNEFPDARIIVLSTYAGDVQVTRALRAGAQGYLVKTSLHKELLDTIRAVYRGKKFLSPEASLQVASHAMDDHLTPAEVSVLDFIAAGQSNKQIASRLSISEETVKSRVKKILAKLGANDRAHAAIIGVRRGIIGLVHPKE
jgi:DNA-binding NarL/FixJ family response regulator